VLYGDIEVGQLVKCSEKVLLVLDKVPSRVYDGFVECLEVGSTRPAQYNVGVLKPFQPREENG
jgi:hypothetical protein